MFTSLCIPFHIPFPVPRSYGREPHDRRSLKVHKSTGLEEFGTGKPKKYLRSVTIVTEGVHNPSLERPLPEFWVLVFPSLLISGRNPVYLLSSPKAKDSGRGLRVM